MNATQRRAHNVLHNQTLLDFWLERNKLRAEGDKLYAERSKLHAERNKLRAEGNKLRAEGDKLYAERSKLHAEGNKLYAEGDKLRAEGDKLRAEGDYNWACAVIAEFGPQCTMVWGDDGSCTLGCGEVYRAVEE